MVGPRFEKDGVEGRARSAGFHKGKVRRRPRDFAHSGESYKKREDFSLKTTPPPINTTRDFFFANRPSLQVAPAVTILIGISRAPTSIVRGGAQKMYALPRREMSRRARSLKKGQSNFVARVME
jgi:hypothetical protein